MIISLSGPIHMVSYPTKKYVGQFFRRIKKGPRVARSTKQFAEYVTTLNDFGKKGGEYGLKAG